MTPALTEIVAPPPSGRMFDFPVRAGLADVTPAGRVRLDALARWLQDAARADLDDGLGGRDWLWVVRRTRIRAERFPRWGEDCVARTWCSGAGSMWAERRTTITGSEALVEAVALWIRIDEERQRPVPPSAACVALFAEAANGRRVKARLRHPEPPAAAQDAPWHFRRADLDMAAHVNNAAYWTILEEELVEPARFDGEIEYRAGAQAGDAIVRHDGPWRWVCGAAGEVTASALVAEAG